VSAPRQDSHPAAGLIGHSITEVLYDGAQRSELVCDALLFVHNGISTRRSCAIAGIAAGLPVMACPNSETAPLITEAGVVLVSPGYPNKLNDALARVLSDANFRAELSVRRRATYKAHFAWPVIAERFAALLDSR
jgi:glycosyltransferase involved in cell wall biosynthesis